jgi:signal transduction histidine kinase
MMKGERGRAEFHDAPEGARWLTAHAPLESLNVAVAAAANYTRAASDFTRAAWLALAVAGLAGIAAIALVFFVTTRATRRIKRVAEGAAAIARGELDSRVRVDASGETGTLTASFNLMSERLREHVRREAETKQFESFMRLSAMLTHDLKNAITGLSMLVSNMERLFDREEFRKDAIESLRDATEKLKRVVARLSEPVKSLSGEYRREARPTDLVPIIKRVLAMNAVPVAQLFEIDVRLPEKLVATVELERIENVVENLVINALEAMGATGGKLSVEAEELEGGLIAFSVSDTGAGMSEEFIRTRLFRPFTTTKTKGIGLGLYTCREVVEAHGGRLEVDSEPGVGTRFRVVLPSTLFQSRERRAEKRTPDASGEYDA